MAEYQYELDLRTAEERAYDEMTGIRKPSRYDETFTETTGRSSNPEESNEGQDKP